MHRWLLAGVIGLALVVRLGMGVFLGFNAPPDRAACGADTEEFENMAWSAAQGEGFRQAPGGPLTAFRAPGYPMFLALLYKIAGGRVYWVNRLALSIVGAATCLLVYLLARKLGLGEWPALIAATITALLPLQFYFCGHFMSEPLATFLNVACVVVLVEAMRAEGFRDQGAGGKCRMSGSSSTKELQSYISTELQETARVAETAKTENGRNIALLTSRTSHCHKSIALVAGAGFLCGLSALVRPASLLVPGVLAVLLLLVRPMPIKKCLVWIVLFAIGMALPITPWTVRNARVFDRFCLIATNGGAVLWGANNQFVAAPSNPKWGYWISSGEIDRVRKQKEVLTLANEVDRDKKEFAIGVEFLRNNPGKIPVLLAGKLYRFLSPFPLSANRVFVAIVALGHIFLLPLSLAGIVMVLMDKQGRGAYFFLFVQLITLIGTVLIYYGSERFRAPYEPLLAIFAAVCVCTMGGRVRRVLVAGASKDR